MNIIQYAKDIEKALTILNDIEASREETFYYCIYFHLYSCDSWEDVGQDIVSTSRKKMPWYKRIDNYLSCL